MIRRLHNSLTTMFLVFAVAFTSVFSSVKATEVKADETKFDLIIDVEYNQTEARKLFDIINEFRQSEDAWFWTGDDEDAEKYYPQGLKDFKYDYALEKVAMQRAAEIAIRFDHFRPQGNSPDYACTDLGFSHTILWAENICVGRASAEEAMKAFREDKYKASGQPHRRTMLAGYSAIGIGYVKLNGVDFWVIDFGMITEEPESEPFDDTVELTIPMKSDYIKSVSAYIDFTVTEGETESLDKIIPIFQPTSGFWKTKMKGIPVKNAITFISADNEYISINENEIVGLKPGTGTITASLFDREFTIEITVEAKPEPVPEVTPASNPTPIPVSVIVVPYNPEDDILPTQYPVVTDMNTKPVTSAAITVDIPDASQNSVQNENNEQTDTDENSDQISPVENFNQTETTEESGQTIPVENSDQITPVENHDQIVPTEEPDPTYPIENSDQTVPVNNSDQTGTTENPGQTNPAENPTQTEITEGSGQEETAKIFDQTTTETNNTSNQNSVPFSNENTVSQFTDNTISLPVNNNVPTIIDVPSYTVTSNDTQYSTVPATGAVPTNTEPVYSDDDNKQTQKPEPKTIVKTNSDGSTVEAIYTITKNFIDIIIKNTSEDNTSESTANYSGTKGNKVTLDAAETTKKTYTVSKYVKIGNKKYYVTAIAGRVLKGNTTVTKLKIGSKVTTIEQNAFKGNKKIKTVEITAKNLKSVEAGAFSKLNSKVKFIIKGSLEDCERVKQLIIESGVSKKAGFKFKTT